MTDTKHRSGFATLIGRPNVGKSTLLNRLTGEKLAIISHKPQTTRHKILGVVNRPDAQVAFVDTPGVHDARGQLNRYMLEVALAAAEDTDLNLFLIEPVDGVVSEVSPGNRQVMEALQRANRPTFLVINKIDSVPKQMLLPLIDTYQKAFSFAQVMPVSARTGEGVQALLDEVVKVLPMGPALYDSEMLTDQQERQLVAEYIREQVLHHCHQEIPYSVAVTVDHFDESDREPSGPVEPGKLGGLIRIAASIHVERDSQKAIVIGKRGQMLKTIGSEARRSIERMLGTHVYLSLLVKVEPRWSETAAGLKKLGYE